MGTLVYYAENCYILSVERYLLAQMYSVRNKIPKNSLSPANIRTPFVAFALHSSRRLLMKL